MVSLSSGEVSNHPEGNGSSQRTGGTSQPSVTFIWLSCVYTLAGVSWMAPYVPYAGLISISINNPM